MYSTVCLYTAMFIVSNFVFLSYKANPITGAPVEGPIPDPLPQEVHFTPTAPREGGQSPDLGLLPGKGCQ